MPTQIAEVRHWTEEQRDSEESGDQGIWGSDECETVADNNVYSMIKGYKGGGKGGVKGGKQGRPTCTYCGRQGHILRECRDYDKVKEAERSMLGKGGQKGLG